MLCKRNRGRQIVATANRFKLRWRGRKRFIPPIKGVLTPRSKVTEPLELWRQSFINGRTSSRVLHTDAGVGQGGMLVVLNVVLVLVHLQLGSAWMNWYWENLCRRHFCCLHL